jgi:uncharacterized protein YcaQ
MSQARRVALRAQGLDRARPDIARPEWSPTMRHVQQVVDRIGLLQIDSVNVLARAHLMPLYSRLGPYDTGLLDRAAGTAPRRLVEYWAHEASFIPPQTYRLLGWRQRQYLTEAWETISGTALQHGEIVREIRDLIAARGPMTASEVHSLYETEHPRTRGEWGWNWTVAKRALEFLFFTGEVTSSRRTPSFERCYDLTARVLPPAVLALSEPSESESIRGLMAISARALGIGTEACLRDYFRLKGAPARRAIAELVEEGTLVPATVRGWERPAYLHADAQLPRRATGSTLISPFDPLVFERRRLQELFGMHYRIEIYVPAARRVHGYYVLPFLLGESLVARVDLKADRKGRHLLVLAAHEEPGAPDETPAALAAELRRLATWLGLEDVLIMDVEGVPARGGLAASLAGALADS